MKELISIAKAFSDRSRIRIIMALAHGEMCVCKITELLALSPSTVSRHMSLLKNAGLVESRKSGTWVHYRLADAPDALAEKALKFVMSSLETDKSIIHDGDRLKDIYSRAETDTCAQPRRIKKRRLS